MRGLYRMAAVETRLVLRDPASLFFVLALPVGMLLIFGLAYREALSFLSGLFVSIALGMVGFYTLPTVLATYREKGILRRLSTTPVHPATLLAVQLAINLALALVAVALVIGVGVVAFRMTVPRNLAGFIVAALVGGSALSSIGLLVAAVAPRARLASALGPLLFWVSLFLAGAWVRREQMPALLGAISDYTPLGATREMLEATWAGGSLHPLQLIAMAAITLAVGAVAARTFRWE